ncbi:MAG: NCS1 family nucleobase:cation symporter-1 [Gammaproteobacteria bacterium]|nr:NCS1 family nucleobase:cation symporter-1 [Gammaproteobacteria bacterium]
MSHALLNAQITDEQAAQVSRDCAGQRDFNPDLAPVPPSARKWGALDMFSLWVALAACVPVYILASSLISGGMNWWQAIGTIALGNLIVLIPMLLNAHAGTKYGIPYPVLCRASFGMRGANLPALLRAFVACGWFGIQCWIGGWALYKILALQFPSWLALPDLPGLDFNIAQGACFIAFWALNIGIAWRGIESVRHLFNIKAPLLIFLALALLAWAYFRADGFGPMLTQPSRFEDAEAFRAFFFPALTANVGLWATLALNIPDFTRYARNQRAQITGQAFGLPLAMVAYSLVGVLVTSATIIIFGEAVWDPVELVARFAHPAAQLLGLSALIIATLATNLAANTVGPANDFANVLPKRISFRAGALITGLIGIAIQPWKLIADPTGYIFTWLVAYSALLGGIGGVMICDYYYLRRAQLHLRDLYRADGVYQYHRGFNPRGIIALCAGIAPCVPGFLGVTGALEVAEFWTRLYHYAWFISFGIAFAVYAWSSQIARQKS